MLFIVNDGKYNKTYERGLLSKVPQNKKKHKLNEILHNLNISCILKSTHNYSCEWTSFLKYVEFYLIFVIFLFLEHSQVTLSLKLFFKQTWRLNTKVNEGGNCVSGGMQRVTEREKMVRKHTQNIKKIQQFKISTQESLFNQKF